MGRVTQSLLDLLEQQVSEHRTVVWFDPERMYGHLVPETVATELGKGGDDVHVAAYDPERGFLALRRDLEPLWSGLEPPRLVIYVPMERDQTRHAIVEYVVGGVALQPGQQPPECNTRLADVARRALAEVLPANKVAEIVGQVERGQLSLAELDRLAERGEELLTGAIAVVFGTGNPQEVALRFLADEALDGQIAERGAQDAVAHLLRDAFGVSFDAQAGLGAMRAQLARLALATELLRALPEAPASLSTVARAESEVAREVAAELARAWRKRRDLVESYVRWAESVEGDLGIGGLDVPMDGLRDLETFRATEEQLQTAVERALRRGPDGDLVALVQRRINGFWAEQDPAIKMRWQAVGDAADVLTEAHRVVEGLRTKSFQAPDLLDRYVGAADATPWCLLDRAQRHLEQSFHNLEPEPHREDELLKLVAYARQQYTRAAGGLAERFQRAYQEAGFEVPRTLVQTHVYKECVEPAGREWRVAYLLVDGLRYEMAHELAETLNAEDDRELVPALGIPPTITEVGMAALMPGAERGVTVVPARDGRLALVVGNKTLAQRQERLQAAEAAITDKIATARLDEIAPLTDVNLRKALEEARLVIVTASEEIDGLWENNPAVARRMMEDALVQLRRGINVLLGLGIRSVVVTADHGYLLSEGVSSGEGIDAPGGETVALHRRCWVGRGGAAAEALLRAPLSAFGVGGDLEYATPLGLGHLRVRGGSKVYFHGGLSLPEVVIPVLTVTRKSAGGAVTGSVQWQLVPSAKRITTRFVSVKVEGKRAELLPMMVRRVRVEARVGKRVISTPVSATYGYVEETKDVEMRPAQGAQTYEPNTVTLMIVAEDLAEGDVALDLVDAGSGVSLARATLPLDIRL